MELLLEISEKDLGKSDAEILEVDFKLRKSARAVLLNEKGDMSIQYVGKWNYYKLPGGGIEIGETKEEALRREIIEEVGCEINDIKEIGVVIEYRNRQGLIHVSHGFLCRVSGPMKENKYEQGEIDDQYKSMWVSLDEAQELLEKHRPDEHYQAKFIVAREEAFLKKAKEVLEAK